MNKKAVNFCKWKQDADGCWDTDCDHKYEIDSGTPSENEMKFCTFCGKKLKEELWSE